MSKFKQKNNDISVLIVEDEIILAMAIELSLRKIGYNISGIETNAKNAILHSQSKLPDIILMDINLNSSDTGVHAANIIWRRFKIPIIFLTSYTNDQTIQAAMECEPYGYLIKPCKDKELKVTIKLALHKHNFFFKNKKQSIHNENHFIQIKKNLKYNKTTSELLKNEGKVRLTKNEKKLFEIVSNYQGEFVSFNTISMYIWREELYSIGKIRTLVYRLKQKVGINAFENMYNEGYKLKVLKNFA